MKPIRGSIKELLMGLEIHLWIGMQQDQTDGNVQMKNMEPDPGSEPGSQEWVPSVLCMFGKLGRNFNKRS